LTTLRSSMAPYFNPARRVRVLITTDDLKKEVKFFLCLFNKVIP
jgi:hypothetical protein